MAITGTDRGVSGNTSSEAATAMSPSSTIAAGSLGVLCWAGDNANAATSNLPSTDITDSVGNTWFRIVAATPSGAANANCELGMWASHITTQLTSSNTVTLTYTAANVTAKCWSFIELAPATAGNTIINRFSGNGNLGSGATSASVNYSTASAGDAVIGFSGAENASASIVGDSDTTNGTWSTQQTTAVGSGATGMAISSQQKIATATVASSYDVTLSASDIRQQWAVFTEAPPQTRACAGRNSSEAATTVTFREPLASGSTAVLLWTGDNAAGTGATANLQTPTLTDSAGNTWTLQQDGLYDPGAAGAGVEVGIYTSTLTNAITRGATVVITYVSASVAGKNWVVFEFPAATAYNASGVGTGATSTAPTVTTSSITDGHYVVGLVGIEGDLAVSAYDTDTTNGSWSSPAFWADGAAGAPNIVAQYKRVTASGTQTYNLTITSADWMTAWVDLTAPSLSTQSPTNGFFLW